MIGPDLLAHRRHMATRAILAALQDPSYVKWATERVAKLAAIDHHWPVRVIQDKKARND